MTKISQLSACTDIGFLESFQFDFTILYPSLTLEYNKPLPALSNIIIILSSW